jgi:G:T-mismatch repair DNA endonuclease (very short patch repair protein)
MPSGVYPRTKKHLELLAEARNLIVVSREQRVCLCGCGTTFLCRAKEKKQYAKGHFFKGKKNKLISLALIGKLWTEDRKKRFSELRKGKSLSKEHILNIKRAMNTLEVKEKLSKVSKGRHYTIEQTNFRISRTLAKVCKRPNTFEIKAQLHLNKLFPSKFKYVGNGSVMINGRSPDFIDLDNKIVVLANGYYWHLERRGLEVTDANKRIVEKIESEPFCNAGYQVMFIWEDELDREKPTKEEVWTNSTFA